MLALVTHLHKYSKIKIATLPLSMRCHHSEGNKQLDTALAVYASHTGGTRAVFNALLPGV